MSIFTRPILEINLNNLVDNFNYLKTLAPHSTAAAVVKDDAYGVGAIEVASILYKKAKCRDFFVAHAEEGRTIRPYVKDANIYVLHGIGDESIKTFRENMLTPVINCKEQLNLWKNNKIDSINPAIHVDTGLNRLGFRDEDLNSLSKDEINIFSLVITHLACADVSNHFMNHQQLDKLNKIKSNYFPHVPSSIAASDGVFLGEEFSHDMIRLGGAMYGINTAPYIRTQIKPIIKITAPIIQISTLKSGDYAGYSSTYKATSDRRIAIVSIGYGDGYPRNLSNTGKVILNNNESLETANIIGRVSMDNITCDITGITNIKTGDMVNIIDEHYTVDDMGRDAKTIGYEIISRICKSTRFDRKYIK